MKNVMEINDRFWQAARISRDFWILCVWFLSTKSLIQKLKDFGWDTLLKKVRSFCTIYVIQVPETCVSFS